MSRPPALTSTATVRPVTAGTVPSTELRCAFITGAASGIGRATAELFAERGWFVGCHDRDGDGLDALRAELGDERAMGGVLDVRDGDAVEASFAAFGERTGRRLDLLFNNAGVMARGSFESMEWDQVEALVDVNVLGSLRVIKTALPLLTETEGSLCLSTSSASASFGVADMAVYSATKHAIRGFTEALAVELHPSGVRVADVLPGIIDTAMLPDDAAELFPATGPFRMISPSVVAETVWDAYHGDSLHWFVPEELQSIDVDVRMDPNAARDARFDGPLT